MEALKLTAAAAVLALAACKPAYAEGGAFVPVPVEVDCTKQGLEARDFLLAGETAVIVAQAWVADGAMLLEVVESDGQTYVHLFDAGGLLCVVATGETLEVVAPTKGNPA